MNHEEQCSDCWGFHITPKNLGAAAESEPYKPRYSNKNPKATLRSVTQNPAATLRAKTMKPCAKLYWIRKHPEALNPVAIGWQQTLNLNH